MKISTSSLLIISALFIGISFALPPETGTSGKTNPQHQTVVSPRQAFTIQRYAIPYKSHRQSGIFSTRPSQPPHIQGSLHPDSYLPGSGHRYLDHYARHQTFPTNTSSR